MHHSFLTLIVVVNPQSCNTKTHCTLGHIISNIFLCSLWCKFFHLDSLTIILKSFLEYSILVVNLVVMRKTINHEVHFIAWAFNESSYENNSLERIYMKLVILLLWLSDATPILSLFEYIKCTCWCEWPLACPCLSLSIFQQKLKCKHQ